MGTLVRAGSTALRVKRRTGGRSGKDRRGGVVHRSTVTVMRRHRLHACGLVVAALVLAGCGSGSVATGRVTAPGAPRLAHWTAFAHADRPLDLVGPRPDASLVLAAAGRLMLLSAGGAVTPFAPGYRSPGGEEPYIAWSPGGCFGTGAVYAIRLHNGRGVVSVAASGGVRRLASLTAPGLIDGIAFDGTGSFGHRLIVTINEGARTTVDAIDCHGRVTQITGSAPRVEGGIAVAPATFGPFAGDLIAPDETGGRIFAITPGGRSVLVAASGLPHGGDIGVESEAFVPRGAQQAAFLADRLTPGNRHPGDNVVLRLSHAALVAAGVRPGDLLVATEGGALTDDVRCSAAGCQLRHVANGPKIAHAEGHIAFAALG